MTVRAELLALEAAGLVLYLPASADLEYRFRHALVQEAAYQSLVRADRQRLHREVAESLQVVFGERCNQPELAPLMAEHLWEAGEESRALDYLSLAGDSAAGVYANAEAAMHYGRALELALRQPAPFERLVHLFTGYGRALELGGQHEAALASYQRMEAIGRQASDRRLELEALILQAIVRSAPTSVMDVNAGEALAGRALRLAQELGDRRGEARSLWNMALACKFAGRFQEAIDHSQAAIALARSLNLRELLAYVLNDVYECYLARARIGDGRAALDEARALWRELGNLPMLADNLTNSSSLYGLTGDGAQALTLAGEALSLSRRTGNLWGQSYSLWNLGQFYAEAGEADQAITHLLEAKRLGAQTGFVVGQAGALIDLAMLYADLGDLPRAEAMVEQTREFLDLGGAVYGELFYASARARLLARAGRAREAQAVATGSSQTFAKASLFGAVLFRMASLEVSLAVGDASWMAAAGPTAQEILQAGVRGMFPEMALLEARLHRARADLGASRVLLEAAAEVARAMGARRREWPVLAELAQVEAALGNASRAQALNRQCAGVIEDVTRRIDDPGLRESFLARTEVRAVLQASASEPRQQVA
jgi:tetratricopeptide (TPR) repeat protein